MGFGRCLWNFLWRGQRQESHQSADTYRLCSSSCISQGFTIPSGYYPGLVPSLLAVLQGGFLWPWEHREPRLPWAAVGHAAWLEARYPSAVPARPGRAQPAVVAGCTELQPSRK